MEMMRDCSVLTTRREARFVFIFCTLLIVKWPKVWICVTIMWERVHVVAAGEIIHSESRGK